MKTMKWQWFVAIGMLLAGGLARAVSLEWDANGTTAPNPQYGSGTWDTSLSNWWNGAANVAWNNANNDDATWNTVNSGNSSISVVGGITVNNMTFNTGPYTFTTGAGGQLTINGAISGSGSWAPTFNVPIIGNSVINTTWSLTLGVSNSYAGATTLTTDNRSITVKANDALGSTAAGTTIGTGSGSTASLKLDGAFSYTMAEPLTINGIGASGAGALQKTGGAGSFVGPITLGSDSLIGTVASANTLTLTGAIGDNGNNRRLIIGGNSTVVLSGNNTYGGGTSIGGGNSPATLVISSDVNLGAVPGAVDADNIMMNEGSYPGALGTGSRLRVTATTSLHANRGITFSSDKSAFEVDAGATFTVNGGLTRTGAGGFTKLGGGTMVLTANATGTPLVGPVIISAGTLQIGNGGSTGILPGGLVTNHSFLVFNRDNTYTTGKAIHGTGTLVQNGSGTLVLDQVNTYTGPTLVNAGTLTASTSGGLANNDSDKVFVRVGGDTFGSATPRLIRTVSDVDFGSTAYGSQSLGSRGTRADLVDSLTVSRTVTMQWRTANSAIDITPPGFGLVSDVLRLDGLNGTNFVLQMSYNDDGYDRFAGFGGLYLGWWNGSLWTNAVAGNTGGTPTFAGIQAYNPSLFNLGTWGVDTNANVVWAVLNHNSDFAVLAVPEVSTLFLLGSGLATVWFRLRQGGGGPGLRRRRPGSR